MTPSAAQLAQLRGETPSEDDDKQKVTLNQDAELRTCAGIVDVGKLIAFDAAAAAQKKP